MQQYTGGGGGEDGKGVGGGGGECSLSGIFARDNCYLNKTHWLYSNNLESWFEKKIFVLKEPEFCLICYLYVICSPRNVD